MNIKQIYEMIKLRRRFFIIFSILGLGFICQTLYFYSNTNSLDMNDRVDEIVKITIKSNPSNKIINSRNVLQGINMHRDIVQNKVKLMLPTNNDNNFTKYFTTKSYSKRYKDIKSKLEEHITTKSLKRNITLTLGKDDILKKNLSNKYLTTKSKIEHYAGKFNVDKDIFAADSNFNADNFDKPPSIDKSIGDSDMNKEFLFKNNKTSSNPDILASSTINLMDHRILGVDKTQLSREEILFGSLKPRNMSLLREEGIRIVSMSLYGSEARYMIGAVENAKLVKTNFPGWTLRFYVESPLTKTPKYGQVPQHVLDALRSLGADVHYILPEEDFLPPMMWRFLVADDPSVVRFVVRDSDSRLTKRDFSAVQAWMKSGQAFQCIRDHPSHRGQSVSGGLWGGESHKLRIILRSSWIDSMRGMSSGYFTDMDFLQRLIWPRVVSHAYCSDSVSCDRWPNSFPFTHRRYGYDHVGEVYDEKGIGRKVDIRILQRQGENENCLPPPDY